MKKQFKPTLLDNNIIVFDLETGGSDPYETEPLEIAGLVIDIHTLQEKEGGRFQSLIRPTDWDLVSDDALQKNKLSRDELREAPEQEEVFHEFTRFCAQFTRKNRNHFDALIPAGFNIKGFDLIIMDRLCRNYQYIDGKWGRQKLFHGFHNFDLADIVRLYFHNSNDLTSYSMDNIRDFFGYPKGDAHRAMYDVESTWDILKRFITMFRAMSPKYIPQFRNSFSQ